eukprot:CAMPEP_0115171862 /NCGR_PEP_ID=MMETSP0270-20121206/2521_1 /TAXON_ID=71861 /ORGANISM="Scrippsiella trochoidea, Strain CCMP3099" /LENGTH=281 /DNA_ID=CAMNT_0002584641 /DNA_START=55 /DNA_END=900 /DNA_ORIENTATION=-
MESRRLGRPPLPPSFRAQDGARRRVQPPLSAPGQLQQSRLEQFEDKAPFGGQAVDFITPSNIDCSKESLVSAATVETSVPTVGASASSASMGCLREDRSEKRQDELQTPLAGSCPHGTMSSLGLSQTPPLVRDVASGIGAQGSLELLLQNLFAEQPLFAEQAIEPSADQELEVRAIPLRAPTAIWEDDSSDSTDGDSEGEPARGRAERWRVERGFNNMANPFQQLHSHGTLDDKGHGASSAMVETPSASQEYVISQPPKSCPASGIGWSTSTVLGPTRISL